MIRLRRNFKTPQRRSFPEQNKTPVLFLSDLDGTWLGKERHLLDTGMEPLKAEYSEKGLDLKFGFVTARPPERLDADLPSPDYKITYNGAQVEDRQGQLQDWNDTNRSSGFTAGAVHDVLRDLLQDDDFEGMRYQTVGQVVSNPSADANPFKVSLCIEQDSIRLEDDERADLNHNNIPDIFEKETFQVPEQVEELMEELEEELEDDGIEFYLNEPYLFHGKAMIKCDISAPRANKGDAVTFLADRQDVRPEHVIVACDGGNDVSMVPHKKSEHRDRRMIVVGPEHTLRSAAGKLKNSIIRPADEDSSVGVYQGLRRHLDAIVADLEKKNRD